MVTFHNSQDQEDIPPSGLGILNESPDGLDYTVIVAIGPRTLRYSVSVEVKMYPDHHNGTQNKRGKFIVPTLPGAIIFAWEACYVADQRRFQ
jgi:hypothetical protein